MKILRYVHYLLVTAVFIAIAVVGSRYRLHHIPENEMAMQPALSPKTFRISRVFHGKKEELTRGVIVLFKDPGQLMEPKLCFSRVVAVEGDALAIVDSNVFVSGTKVDEPYVREKGNMGTIPEIIIPRGCVFVLNDHRPMNWDSRQFGPLPLRLIEGKIQ